MSNHVHILIWPKRFLPVITKAIKGYTAYKANRVLDKPDKPFGKKSLLIMRSEAKRSFYRIKRYIEQNPVKAGLVKSPEEWRWSSAAK